MKTFLRSMLVILLGFSFSIFATPAQKHFIAISDIHFDPFLACGNVKPCPLIDELCAAPVTQWDKILNQYDVNGDSKNTKNDTSYSLLISALNAIQKTTLSSHPRFALLLGDYIAHNYQIKFSTFASNHSEIAYEKFVEQTNAYLVAKFAQALPKTNVYMAAGNNDAYDDYVIDPNNTFFHDMAGVWSQVIKDKNSRKSVRDNLAKWGYYSITLPHDKHLRLIVLNSTLFSPKAMGPNKDTQAVAQMTFLQQALEAARENHQKVLIAMHIPPAVDVYASLTKTPFTLVNFWENSYTSQFKDLLNQYHDCILGVLAGHTHLDWFETVNTEQGPIAISMVPAISPIFGNAPGYKVYDYSDSALINFVTYKNNLTSDQSWGVEYNFNEIYQPACSDCQLINGMANLTEDNSQLVLSYVTHFDLGQNTQPINSHWSPYYYCQIVGMTADDYQQCLDARLTPNR